ncbi:MAG TPA: AAA family ATPase [Thermoleophilia bacterium]|nr:AAA family ATPase [Thermoleophilia bacterium]
MDTLEEGRGDRLIYAVANQKGGVGKTTTAINLAATLAQAGERVLLIDLDPQANATTGLGLRVDDGRPSMFEVLLGEETLGKVLLPTPVSGLWVAPSSRDMAGASVVLPGLERREYLLRDALAALGPEDAFSFVFIDCPPSLGLLTVNALVAADEVVVPVQAEYYALEGLAQLLDTVEALRGRLNPGLQVAGLVLTMADVRTRLAREVENELRSHFPGLTFKTVVPRNVRLAEAPSFGLPVSLLDPRCPGSDAYFDLAKEVIARD